MALIDSLRDIYGPYLWEPGTGGPSFTLSDSGGIGHAVAYDRAFDLTVTGQGDGLALIALTDLDQASHVTLRAQVSAGDIGLGIQTLASPLWVQNFGTIQGTTAIYATTDGPGLLRIDNGGQIIGEVGIDTWLGAELRNLAGGQILASQTAIHAADVTLTNDGRIEVTGNTPAIEVWGETATIVNHGQILAPGLAIDLGGFWGTLSHVTNAGEITGGLLGSKQADEVINTGTMGDVWLGAGDDLVTNGGTMGEVWLGAGNDQFTGLRQGRVHAGIGDDVLTGGKAADQLYGDEGRDTMTGGAGADQLFGGGEADVLSGGAGADRLYGGQSRDTLTGGAGDDRLFGGDGADRLSGGTGNDWLSGGAGADTLWGGAGADVFVLSPLGKGLDWIRDFERGTDHIRLQDGLTWIGTDDFSGQGGEVRWNSQYEGMMADLDGDGIWDWSAKLERVYQFDLQDFV